MPMFNHLLGAIASVARALVTGLLEQRCSTGEHVADSENAVTAPASEDRSVTSRPIESPAMNVGEMDARTEAIRLHELIGALTDGGSEIWRSATDPAELRADWARRLAVLPPADRARYMTDLVCDAAALVVHLPAADSIDADSSLFDQGLDSITSLTLHNRLTLLTGLDLAATFAFEHTTAAALGAHFAVELSSASGSEEPLVESGPDARGPADEPDVSDVDLRPSHPISELQTDLQRLSAFLPSPSDDEQPTPDELSAVALTAEQTLDQALATLFIQLGPPPDSSEMDYMPTSNGGGGVQQ
ncbi:phosphopantetheine-binding protein [Streptomyces microflavus]|uniref:acyl carrier protein n=1 Tax=Streptomyces microflavus TaxID=1919 RepID=UPI003B2269D6